MKTFLLIVVVGGEAFVMDYNLSLSDCLSAVSNYPEPVVVYCEAENYHG